MDLPIEQRGLPDRFPVGAIYVVEGHGGARGRLRISSRYVLLPGGHRIDIPGKLVGTVQTLPERLSGAKAPRQNRAGNGSKIFSARAKKFAAKRGTSGQERR